MAVVTADWTIVWANTAMRALAGAGRDGLAGRPLADCLCAPAHRCLAILAESCRTTAPLPFSLTLAATGEPVQCRVQAALLARGPDRSTTTVWVRLVQDTEASKNFRRLTQRIADLNRKVLARQSAEHALRESEARLAGIISSAMDAIITIDARHRIMDFNGAAERMFRCEAASAVGRSIDGLIPARYRAGHAAHIEAFGLTQVTKRQMGALGTIYGRRADGEEFPIEASISQLETHAGKFYTVILRDITERTRVEEALTSVNAALTARTAALAEANQELESFSYSVSLDLRAPLRTIDAFGRILQEEHSAHLNAEGLRCLAIVRRAAAQAGELIDDLLALSRLGRQSMQIRPVDMAALAREAVEDCPGQPARSGPRADGHQHAVDGRRGGHETHQAGMAGDGGDRPLREQLAPDPRRHAGRGRIRVRVQRRRGRAAARRHRRHGAPRGDGETPAARASGLSPAARQRPRTAPCAGGCFPFPS